MPALFELNDVLIHEGENDEDTIKEIIESHGDDPFFIFDIEMVVRNHRRWLEKMPRVTPYYAVKCNPNPTLIRLLAALNVNFDCASKQEMQLVMNAGVSKDRILFANPMKALSQIRFAKDIGVEWTTVDTKDEILKLKNEYPDAKLLIRLAIDGSVEHSGVNFSGKFGCEPTTGAIELMEYMKKIGMTLLGFCFHLGSPCWDTKSFGRAVNICNDLLNIAKTMGHLKAKLIDIGGGINGRDHDYFDRVAISVNTALEGIDPSIEVISEPGRFYAETPFTLSACIIGKKIQENSENIKRIYYVNESTYGSFIEELLDLSQRIPTPLYHLSDEKYPSRIWGRTCDPFDNIIKNEEMQDFKVGEWLMWRDFGAYTLSLATNFNGFDPAVVYPFIRKSDLDYVLSEIKKIQTIHN